MLYLEYLRRIIERDFPTFSGIMLERYFRAMYVESGQYTDIGNFWDRKGENEIDLIATLTKRSKQSNLPRSNVIRNGSIRVC